MPSAVQLPPTPNQTAGAMGAVYGLVLHIQQGYEAGSESWFRNPKSKASAHFLNPKRGRLRQLVDTRDMAWAQAAGNPHWISLENEGFVPYRLTDDQLENAAQLLAWLHTTHSVPVQPTDSPTGRGLGWHGMGGAAWGGHPDCPGDGIKGQRGDIIVRAAQILAPPAPAPAFPGRAAFVLGRSNPAVTLLGRQLVKAGYGRHYTKGPGPVFTEADRLGVADFQRAQGWRGDDADGFPGPETWRRLFA